MFNQIFSTLIFLLLASGGVGQSLVVWPGDANNSGRVTKLDFLQMGLGYNFFGTARQNPTPQWVGQPSEAWVSAANNGTLNFAYADCNGDGIVNFSYDAFPIYVHYGKTHGTVTEDVFQSGQQGVDPSLFFDRSAVPQTIQSGTQIKLPLVLGSADLPVEGLYGLAFDLEVDSAVGMNSGDFSVDLGEISWANHDNDRVFMTLATSPRQIDCAWTRTDHNGRNGFGRIGSVDFIVIVDVVAGFQQLKLTLKNIKLVDKFGNETAVAGDTLTLTIPPPSTSDDEDIFWKEKVEVFPNPAVDVLTVVAPADLLQVQIFNALGQAVFSENPRKTVARLPVAELSDGYYFLKIKTRLGTEIRPFSIRN